MLNYLRTDSVNGRLKLSFARFKSIVNNFLLDWRDVIFPALCACSIAAFKCFVVKSTQELCAPFNSFHRPGFAFILITKNVKNKRSNLQRGNATVAPPMKFTRFQGIL